VIVRVHPAPERVPFTVRESENDLIRVLCRSLFKPSATLLSNAEIKIEIPPRLYRHAVPLAHGFRGSL
jgi:hypothetical protein